MTFHPEIAVQTATQTAEDHGFVVDLVQLAHDHWIAWVDSGFAETFRDLMFEELGKLGAHNYSVMLAGSCVSIIVHPHPGLPRQAVRSSLS